MGGMFSKPKTMKPPPVPDIEPPPTVTDTGIEEAEKKAIKKKSGRAKTFLTGDLVPDDEKKKVLG